MNRYPCLYLKGVVDLTDERERPDQVRQSVRFGSAKLFSRWYTDIGQGKHVVVVVVSELGADKRH